MIPLVSREGVAGARGPAEPDGSARPGGSVAHAVAHLPWLAPSALSLGALCRPAEDPWEIVRHDPGLLILLLRQSSHGPGVAVQREAPGEAPGSNHAPLATGPPWDRRSLRGLVCARLQQPVALEEAVGFLRGPPTGVVDWSLPGVAPVYRFSWQLASYARAVAETSSCCLPDDAWIAGFLAPLGWLGVAAVLPDAVAQCLHDPGFATDPIGTQRKLWGLDHAALARRLAQRWGLPDPVRAVAGFLGLPTGAAESLGADPGLFSAVRQALALIRGMSGIADLRLLAECLPTSICNRKSARSTSPLSSHHSPPGDVPAPPAADPYQQPWLLDLLALAAENKRLRDDLGRGRQADDFDLLYEAMREQVDGEAQRLCQSKVEAMAEFAAGAGHEINNPLAVISGQAQYLLGHEADWFLEDPEGKARRALHAIIAQTRRIHGLLRDLMLYARPAPAQATWTDLPSLLGEIAAAFADQAAQRQVRIELLPGPDRLPVLVDADQVKTALGCLVRNAVEAAPPEGWVRLSLRQPVADDFLEVAVEDSGPGPEAAQVPSLFDPFFSGRSAGRGKGLGLPVAWRLARQHGGDVRLDELPPAGPTRFVLRLARSAPPKTPLKVVASDVLTGSPAPNGSAICLPLAR